VENVRRRIACEKEEEEEKPYPSVCRSPGEVGLTS
jgi:hypothetical protein